MNIRFHLVFSFALLTHLASSSFADEFAILSWNIDGRDSDPAVIEKQLEQMRGSFDIVSLTGVPSTEENRFGKFFGEKAYIIGGGPILLRGRRRRIETRPLIAWDTNRFELVTSTGGLSTIESSVPPLGVTLRLKHTDIEFHLIGFDDLTLKETVVLMEWAEQHTEPTIAVGEIFPPEHYQPTYPFREMSRHSHFRWIEPEKTIDTCWKDSDRDGVNDYANELTSYAFVAHTDWKCENKIIVRDGDFPDTPTTSGYRPTLTKITTDQSLSK